MEEILSPPMTVRLVQHRLFASSEATVAHITELCRDAPPADLVVCAEIALQNWLRTGEADPGREQAALAEATALASQLQSEMILTLRLAGANRWMHFSQNGEIRACYDKVHLFSPLREHERYHRGNRLVVSKTTTGVAVAAAVCYDLRFPEMFRVLRARGAELFVVPARWPGDRLDHWRILCQARALENQCWLVGLNACGMDPAKEDLIYAGGSLVVSPRGEIVAEAGADAEVLTVSLDLSAVTEFRSQFPVWQDRRLW